MANAVNAVGVSDRNGVEAPPAHAARAAVVPWYIWAGVAAVTSSAIGAAWDVSWHRTIGRDTFWTPAHMMIYLCGVLAGIVGIYLVAQCTFGRDPAMRAASVSIFGLRAPLGIFLAGWGGLAMLTSAPFDNWWHNAYGLDVKIVSPPHTLLILGLRGVAFGVLFLILSTMNRSSFFEECKTAPRGCHCHGSDTGVEAEALAYRPLTRTMLRELTRPLDLLRVLFLYVGGLIVGGQMFFLQEYTWDVKLHRAGAYIAMAIAIPVLFAGFREASRYRWAATATAAVYTAVILLEILILPLFPAQPKLGPVYNPVTHLVPAKFPILLLAPAFALDLLWQRARGWRPWKIAVVSGIVFVAVLTAVEWPFASFLLSKASQNRFFGTIYFNYNARADGWDRMRLFFHPEHGRVLARGLMQAACYAAISTWIGLGFGRWMRGVER